MSSLNDLRELRRQGYTPRAVLVAVDMPQSAADAECTVYIRASEEPRRLDWRALFGLRAAFFFPAGSQERGEAAFTAACRAGCIPVGIVVGGCVSVLEDEFAAPLARGWELLCTS